MELLRQSFRPEFLNRIDEIIVFRALDREQLKQITRLLLDRVSGACARRVSSSRSRTRRSSSSPNAGFDPSTGRGRCGARSSACSRTSSRA